MKKAIFLDRDGVINKCIVTKQKCYAPKLLKDFKLFPYTKINIQKLKKMNFMVFVVTNQPDIGNNLITKEILTQMHLILKKKLLLILLKFVHIVRIMVVPAENLAPK